MTAQEIVDVLNNLFETDPNAIDALMCNRVPVNEDLLEHPTAMCHVKNEGCDFPTIGLLGVLQAIVGIDGELIEACYDDQTRCLTNFRLRQHKEDNNVCR